MKRQKSTTICIPRLVSLTSQFPKGTGEESLDFQAEIGIWQAMSCKMPVPRIRPVNTRCGILGDPLGFICEPINRPLERRKRLRSKQHNALYHIVHMKPRDMSQQPPNTDQDER